VSVIPAAKAVPSGSSRRQSVRAGVLLTTCHPNHWTQTQVFDNTTALACAAEKIGYDCVWVLEHHFTPYGLCPNTFSMAGYLLGRTTRINVGAAIAVAPIEHPVRLAEQVCLLDQLSHGRFIAGVGRGFFPKAFEVFGIDPGESHQRLHEWTAIIRKACVDRSVAWDSDLITLPDVTPFPEPYTKPAPPIYTVAVSPSTVEWAASVGLPMLLQLPFELETLRSQLELYNETALAHGHDPAAAEHVLTMLAHISDDTESAQQEILDNLIWWTKEGDASSLSVDTLRTLPNYRYHYNQIQAAIHRGEDSVEKVVRRMLDSSAVGSPEVCVDRLRTIVAETGVRNFGFAFEGVLDRDRIIATMRRFATEVLPHV
jgi:alkanal monooxygenase alpha chain